MLFELILYSDWPCSETKNYVPSKRFAQQCPIKEGFQKKWAVPDVDPALKEILVVPVEDGPVFKCPVDKWLKVLLKVLFSLAGPPMQPVVATVCVQVFQSILQIYLSSISRRYFQLPYTTAWMVWWIPFTKFAG